MKTRTYSESGSVRLGLLLLGIMAGLFWKGGQDLYTALANSRQTVLTYSDYVEKRPQATWLKLTDCRLYLPGAAYKSYGKSSLPTELYIPVRGVTPKEDEKTVVFFVTRDPQLLAACKEMMTLKSEGDAFVWALKNQERVFPRRDISGLVRFGIDMKDEERRQLAKLQEDAVKDFIILDDGAKPSLASGLGYSGVGLMLLVGGVFYLRKSREEAAGDNVI